MSRTNPKNYSRSSTKRKDAMDQIRSNARSSRGPSRRLTPRSRPGRVVPQAANYFDTAFASYAADTTGTITLVNPVPQGVTTTTRIGKRVLNKSLQVQGIATPGTTAAIGQWAFVLVYDRRPQGALPAITDIFNSVSPNSFLNDTNANRFKILKRIEYCYSGISGGTDSSVVQSVDFYYRFPEKFASTSYKALGTGAIADIDEGAYYLVTMGGNAPGVTAATVQWGARLRFYDQSG